MAGVRPLAAARGLAAAAIVALMAGCASGGGSPERTPIVVVEPPPPPSRAGLETFPGRNDLRARIEAAVEYRGKLVVFDYPDTSHADRMRAYIVDEGVPEDRIEFPGVYLSGAPTEFVRHWPDLYAETYVVAIPLSILFVTDPNPGTVAESNIVWVGALGNVEFDESGWPDYRYLWYPDHPHWHCNVKYWIRDGDGRPVDCAEDHPGLFNPRGYENNMAAFATGKVLVAGLVRLDEDRNYIGDFEGHVRCGEAKHACLKIPNDPVGKFSGTSGASVRLGAAAYYLRHLFETAEEVVSILLTCAIDIGEPGVDEEFGHGVPSLDCDEVRDAEVLTAGSSLNLVARSPGLDRLLLAGASENPIGVSRFASLRGWDDDTARGHAGAAFPLGQARIAAVFGVDAAPLGAWSKFSRLRRTPFAALGARVPLWQSGLNGAYAAAAYGREAGEISSVAIRAGAQYERRLGDSGTFSLYAGHVRVRAEIGIPGYREAGLDKVRAERAGWEARLAFALRF